MIIDPHKARRFIDSYMNVTLAMIDRKDEADDHRMLIARGRQRLVGDPDALDAVVKRRLESGLAPHPDVVEAIRTLRLRKWIYLRDTRSYSVFVDPKEEAAYAVLGLTERIRDLLGDSGVMIETGVVEYDGQYVCDGIITGMVWLGVNTRRSLVQEFDCLKSRGRFFRRVEGP